MNHQETMDKAYAVWQSQDAASYLDFLRELDGRSRFAVVLGNLNQQVQNGGWSQWVGNGYALAIGDVLWALQKLDSKTSKRVIEMVKRVARAIQGHEGDLWGEASERAANVDDLHCLSEAYYVVDETLMAEVETFLATWE